MLAPDKIAHIKAGAMAAAFGCALSALITGVVLLMLLSIHLPAAVLVAAGVGALVAAATAGIAKEKADEADNLIYPGMHSVEVTDAVATAAPGAVLCVLLCGAAYLLNAGLGPWAA